MAPSKAQATNRLRTAYSNFAGAIRGCQRAGMTHQEFEIEVAELIIAWGLNR